MSRPYSEDLRTRGVAAVESGLSCHRVAVLFSVGVSSVIRWRQLKVATGSVKAKPMGGNVKPKLAPERDWIVGRIAAEPSLTLEELRRELAERGVRVAHGTLWLFLDRQQLSFNVKSRPKLSPLSRPMLAPQALAFAVARRRSAKPLA